VKKAFVRSWRNWSCRYCEVDGASKSFASAVEEGFEFFVAYRRGRSLAVEMTNDVFGAERDGGTYKTGDNGRVSLTIREHTNEYVKMGVKGFHGFVDVVGDFR
jgi:hypothetical protein